MTIIFRAKTKEAYRIKILAELLSNNIKTGCFIFDETGISLRMMDNHRTILIDVALQAENFNIFKHNSSKKLYLGINLQFFWRMIRSIKKKDNLELSIDDKTPNELSIQVIPKENNRVSTSFIKIQNVQNLDIDIPENNSRSINVNSSEFMKMVKDMSTIGTTINVTSRNYKIEFNCNAGGILKRKVVFGEEDEDEDDDEDNTISEKYSQDFLTEQFSRITKLSGLSTDMHIYPGTPLLFRSNVGGLGKISIYIKSKEQMEQEDKIIMESDYDSD